jgi:hypothetical protein
MFCCYGALVFEKGVFTPHRFALNAPSSNLVTSPLFQSKNARSLKAEMFILKCQMFCTFGF